MKKFIRLLSCILAFSIFSSASVYAAEGATEYISSLEVTNSIDAIKNFSSNVIDSIDIEDTENSDNDKFFQIQNKNEWTADDVYAMYEKGFSIFDIGKAMELSKRMDVKPYTLLEKKGKPKYSTKKISSEAVMFSDATILDTEEPLYTMKRTEEKSWDAVIAETENPDLEVTEDLQFIKNSGLAE
ncbi:MAG: hypothetical protein IJ366_06100, partial [Clostridia bacterium]|nr:hypothetical protein [Clostridia bacterium]